MTATPRSLLLLIGYALLAAISLTVHPAFARATTTPAPPLGGQPSTARDAAPGPPAAIVLTGEPSTIRCDGAHSTTLTATVTDASGAPVPDGVPVSFHAITYGVFAVTVSPVNTVTKDGMASSIITPLTVSSAGATTIVSAGPVQVSIRTDCILPGETGLQPPSEPGPTDVPSTAPEAVILTAEPSTIPCDEVHTSSVTAIVTDASGARVRDGWRVDFTVLALGVATPAHTGMIENGIASFVFTQPFGTVDHTTIIAVSGKVQTTLRVDCLLPQAREPMPVIERYGGQLSIGTPLGKTANGLLVVPINTTAAPDPYYGYAIHVEFDGALIDAHGSDDDPTFGGSTLDAGGVAGFEAGVGPADANSIRAEAFKPGGQSTMLAGTMTHIWLQPRPGAVGCSYLHLVTLGAPDGGTGGGPPPAFGVTGSYTINAADGYPQLNSYGPDAGVDVQTGKACIASAPALPRSGTGDARGGGLPLLAMAAMLCSLAAGTGLVIAGRVARRTSAGRKVQQ